MTRKSDNPITVAIVDDDLDTRTVIGRTIERAAGFELVGRFPDAESAIRALPGDPPPDIVIMDVNMPDIDGIEAVRRLKPEMPDVQFLMLTVYDDSDNIFGALSAGATGYVLKRAPREELLDSLRDIHAGGSPMSGAIARKVVRSFREAQPTPKSHPPELAELSPREREVLDQLARGYLYKEIAGALGISVTTVNTYVRRIYEKLHVHSRSQAVAVYSGQAVENG